MIKLILASIFTSKRRKVLFLYLIFVFITLFLIVYEPSNHQTQLLHRTTILYDYQNKFAEFMKFFMPLTLAMLFIEHDQGYIRNLISYKGRVHVHFAKQMAVLIIVSFIYSIIFIIYLAYPKYFTSFYSKYLFSVHDFLYSYLTGIIFCQALLLFVREKQRIIAFLLVLCFIVFGMVQELIEHLAIFYLLPIHGHLFKNYQLSLIYQFIYIICLCYINFWVSKKEQLSI